MLMPHPAYWQKIYLSPKTSAQNIHLRRIKLFPVLKRIARMFERCCEETIVLMSESLSQRFVKHLCEQNKAIIDSKKKFFTYAA